MCFSFRDIRSEDGFVIFFGDVITSRLSCRTFTERAIGVKEMKPQRRLIKKFSTNENSAASFLLSFFFFLCSIRSDDYICVVAPSSKKKFNIVCALFGGERFVDSKLRQ